MIGSIIGDIVGSIYEFNNLRSKDFEFFTPQMEATDDSILTVATADWLLHGGNVANYYARYANTYPFPMGGYGNSFRNWAVNCARHGIVRPYNSCGNGSAMRVGPVGWAFESDSDTMEYARLSAECTHNHPEGVKGAQVVAMCILTARRGKSASDIRAFVEREFGYDLTMDVASLQKRYSWQGIDGKGNGEICQDSVPQAIICALAATDFEDAVRNAISIGGDSDTIGCITGAIAEALFGIPERLCNQAQRYLPPELLTVVNKFEEKYGNKQH